MRIRVEDAAADVERYPPPEESLLGWVDDDNLADGFFDFA
jgi:hypothetical protein